MFDELRVDTETYNYQNVWLPDPETHPENAQDRLDYMKEQGWHEIARKPDEERPGSFWALFAKERQQTETLTLCDLIKSLAWARNHPKLKAALTALMEGRESITVTYREEKINL